MSSCWGSSWIPGWPRHVTMSSVGIRNGQLSDVSGLMVLPRPEFWHMTTVWRPVSQAPAAIATASPSLVAPTYHNEADEPLATQPMMYNKIREQMWPRRTYAEQLIREGVIAEGEDVEMSDAYFAALEADHVMSRPLIEGHTPEFIADWSPYLGTHWRDRADTTLTAEQIERLGLKLCDHPVDFELHRSVQRIVDARREMARGEKPMDWGFAECLAYAAVLEDGYSVRISGQDSQRGTFFHRHAVLHNQKQRGTHTPLEHVFDGHGGERCRLRRVEQCTATRCPSGVYRG